MILEVNSESYKFKAEINRRLTVIRGDSATGKSSLTRIIQLKPASTRINCELAVKAVTEDLWLSSLKSEENVVLVFDDLRCVETKEFAKACKDNLVKNNLYIIIINRAENFEWDEIDNQHMFDRLSISLNEIYDFKTDGIEHWLEHISIPKFDCKGRSIKKKII